MNTRALLTGLAVLVSVQLAAADRKIAPPTSAQAEEYGLDPAFFKKVLMVQEILIANSERVSDYALYQFDRVMRSIGARDCRPRSGSEGALYSRRA
jgi:hypothetical protein